MIRNLRLLAALPFAAVADLNRYLYRRIAGCRAAGCQGWPEATA